MRAAPSILLVSVMTLILACSDSTGPSQPGPGPDIQEPTAPSSLQISPSSLTLVQGQSRQLTTSYSGNPALTGGPSTVAWHSSNESVASVSPTGLVRGIGVGQARILAVWGGEQASALITVVGPMKKHEGPPVCLQQDSGTELLIPLC